MEKGTLIEHRPDGKRKLGIIDRPDGKKNWIVIDERGQSRSIAGNSVTYQVLGQTYQWDQLSKFLADLEPYLDFSALEVAWELCIEDHQNITNIELAELLFSQSSPLTCYAAYILLDEDKIFFKKKGNHYEPKTRAQVADSKYQVEVALKKQQQKLEFFNKIEQAKSGIKVEWDKKEVQKLESIQKYAIVLADAFRSNISPEAFNRSYPPSVSVMETLKELGCQGTPPAAFQLLVDLGWWDRYENLFLHRAGISMEFSSNVCDLMEKYIKSPPPDLDENNRIDLTYLKVYTIDDESTTEIDDGVSLEFLADGQQKIWIHIADPSRLIIPGDELDLEARKRTTTIYLPTGMVPMFPRELATGPMSLIQGKLCCAVSFGVILSEGGEVVDYSIHPSWIKPTYRLTYEDVNEMLELGIDQELEIIALSNLAAIRQLWRKSQGAIHIQMPEAVIKVKNDEIIIKVVEESKARQLVSEMMILTGELAARYGQTNQIPLPFRSQPRPELPPEQELELLPIGPVRYSAMRRCMPRSEMGITPSRHASLGLNSYAQVTSPIRRYSDLLAHFQIKAHLRGDALPFSSDQLQEIMITVVPAALESNMVERQTNRFWGLEYLRRNIDQIWDTLMLRWLREDEFLGLILLEELALEFPMRFNYPVKVGSYLKVKVSYVDPHFDIIQFQQIMTDNNNA